MPSLNAMRQLESGDTVCSQPLGPAVQPTKPEPVAPPPKPTGTPGVFERADGKLETNLPTPSSWDGAIERPNFTDLPKTDPRLRGQRATTAIFDDLQPRQPKVGDWVRILSGQRGFPTIERMVGGVFQITSVGDTTIKIGTFSFCPPGKDSCRGQLRTEYAEAPGLRDFSDLERHVLAYGKGARQTFANEHEIDEDTFVAAFLALSIAEAAKSLPPSDGAMWTAHDPVAGATSPKEWRYAVLRNGQLREKSRLGVNDWSTLPNYDYQVVAYK